MPVERAEARRRAPKVNLIIFSAVPYARNNIEKDMMHKQIFLGISSKSHTIHQCKESGGKLTF